MFFEKIKGLMPIFCQKSIYSLKAHFSNVHILSKKRPFSQKHIVLTLFFQISHEKLPAFIPTLSLKTSILSKLIYIMDPKSQ